MPAPLDRVAVLGLGLIGGSLARALTDTGRTVWGYDPSAHTAAAARADGLAVRASATAAVAGAELVVLAMPLPAVAPTLDAIAGVLAPAAVLTDVGTLKRPVTDLVAALAPRARFVGGHPLAGTEDSGWAAGTAALFADAPWVLTLEAATDLDAWLSLAALVCDLGARPAPVGPDEQDATVARVIGLPHVLAETLALTGVAGGPLGLSLAAGSYRSTSRVARTRPELVATWCDDNPALVTALDDVIARLTATRDDLAAGRSVLPLAEDGHSARMFWEHRGSAEVTVPANVEALLAHGRVGGWLTSVSPDGTLTGRVPT